jgi:cholest-4-en-3-one 26-monooxygenase
MASHPTRADIHLLDRFFYLDPHPRFAWMRDHAPAYFEPDVDSLGGIWGLTRHADIMHASKHPELFSSAKSSRPEPGSWIPSMINLDDPLHKRRRNLVNRGFTVRRVADHEVKLHALCDELIDAVSERGECDFVADIARWVPMVVIGDMLGVAPEDRGMLLHWSDEMLGGGESAAIEDGEQRLARARAMVEEYLRYAQAVIADRRKRAPTDDLMSILVHSELDGDRLAEEEILQESLLILIGGDETTRHVMTGGLRALIGHPDQKRKLIEDPALIPTAVEEMLRWVTPLIYFRRTATRDCEIRGVKIRENDKVVMYYPSANRDEELFADPMKFDITRTPNEHLAFGIGQHFCLGSNLARLEIRVMFEELLRRMPDIELAGPVRRLRSNFLNAIKEMPVQFRPQKMRALP